jgi:hypothetical protein
MLFKKIRQIKGCPRNYNVRATRDFPEDEYTSNDKEIFE